MNPDKESFMAYAATANKNSGPGNQTIPANFGACPVETSGIVNAGTLKVAGVAALGGIASLTTFTQTYSTADPTIPNATYTAPTATGNTIILTGTNIAAKTPSLTLTDAVATNAGTVATSLDQAQKDLGTAINTLNTNLASTNTQLAALAADVLLLKKAINSIVDSLQANALAA